MKNHYLLTIQCMVLSLIMPLCMSCISPYAMTGTDTTVNTSDKPLPEHLYGFLMSMPEGSNSAMSPKGVKWLAAMMYAGADGQTAAELKTAFRFDNEPGQVARQLNEESSEGIKIANGMWADSQLSLKSDFQAIMKNDFEAHFFVGDFVNELEIVLVGKYRCIFSVAFKHKAGF